MLGLFEKSIAWWCFVFVFVCVCKCVCVCVRMCVMATLACQRDRALLLDIVTSSKWPGAWCAPASYRNARKRISSGPILMYWHLFMAELMQLGIVGTVPVIGFIWLCVCVWGRLYVSGDNTTRAVGSSVLKTCNQSSTRRAS